MRSDFFQRAPSRQPAKTRASSNPAELQLGSRLNILAGVFFFLAACVITRLGYWQLVKSDDLRAEAASQYQRKVVYEGQRGNIYTADNFLLVTNQPVFHLFGQPHVIKEPAPKIARQLLPILTPTIERDWALATDSGTLSQRLQSVEAELAAKLAKPNSKWVPLFQNLVEPAVTQIKELSIAGLVLEKGFQRTYPEASLAAQVLGFVGHSTDGQDTGYFGIEGALNKELQSKQEQRTIEADAIGGRLAINEHNGNPNGRDVVLTLRRDVQFLAETSLKAGMEKYGAAAGEVIIMQPKTGKILAMAAYPSYNPTQYRSFTADLYKNPSVSNVFEPGSTFKTLTVAAGIDSGVISENTQCPQCAGPRTIAGYTLKTWNDQYTPNITMTDGLAKSDNTAMIYIAEQVGKDRFQSYLKKFGIGSSTNVELQEDFSPHFPDKWGPVELATRSFGQGIGVTSLQLVKAVNAIANHGQLMRPLIVEKVLDPTTQQTIDVNPIAEGQVITAQTAETVTRMMINSAAHGEAKWTASRTHLVAGKTGTAQVAVNGQYDATKTIASFIGFAPAHDPQFIMLVKLTEPQSSPWAAETAAPLWYQIANKLYLLLNIPPDFAPGATASPTPAATAHEVTLD